jgi:hypothetical protein
MKAVEHAESTISRSFVLLTDHVICFRQGYDQLTPHY